MWNLQVTCGRKVLEGIKKVQEINVYMWIIYITKYHFLEFTEIDHFIVMYVVFVLMFSSEIITNVVQIQLMTNAVFVSR
jgi:hypothetical protein